MTSRILLTDIIVRNLAPPAKGVIQVQDIRTPGFGVRVTAGGAKSFFYRSWSNGAARRFSLGRYPAVKLAHARKLAEEANHYARAKRLAPIIALTATPSVPPSTPNPPPTEPSQTSLLFPEALSQYLDLHCKLHNRPSTIAEKTRILRANFEQPWRKTPIAEITKADVLKIIDGIVRRGSPRAATYALDALKALFNWCVDRDYIQGSPCARLKDPSPSNSRDRVLKPKEIRALWSSSLKEGFPFGTITQLALLTAQRLGEVSGMTWDELDFEKNLWNLPGRRTKNGRPHVVPLSPFAVSILKEIKRIETVSAPEARASAMIVPSRFHANLTAIRSPFVFPARNNPLKPVSNCSKGKSRIADRTDIVDWRLHDLRRTATTMMGQLGVTREIQKLILNHVRGSVTDIYDRYEYIKERREALERWASCLESIIASDIAPATLLASGYQPLSLDSDRVEN